MLEFNDLINNCMLVGQVIKKVKRKGTLFKCLVVLALEH